MGALGIYGSIAAAKYQPVYAPDVKVGGVPVGGLSLEQAQQKLKAWWQARQMDPITLTNKALEKQPKPMAPVSAGLVLDIEATLAQLETETFLASVGRMTGVSQVESATRGFIWKLDDSKIETLAEFVEKNSPPIRPARLFYDGKNFKREREGIRQALNKEAMLPVLIAATEGDGAGELPLVTGEKRVPDEILDSMKKVLATFRTTMPYNSNRCSNIKLASSKIDGLILLPGEVFSYNETVGERTVKAGFKEAGVYANGRHDTGIGGGICQVSTTLYNAVLLADLQIVERQNHSMPVAYVPVGRDATVNWGSIDFKFKNNLDQPIAVTRIYTNNSITFNLIGIKKDPGVTVEIVRGPVRSWATGVKTIRDPSLPAGLTVVEEMGTAGRSTQTWRVVKKDGKVIKRESLGVSHYAGGKRIVRVGTAAVAKPKVEAPAGAPPAEVAPANPPIE